MCSSTGAVSGPDKSREIKRVPTIIPPGAGSKIIHPAEDLSLVCKPKL
jgi:hypothetical protein